MKLGERRTILRLVYASAAIMMSACNSGGGDPANEIAIAAIGPLTGIAAERGKEMDRAVRMAADEANAASTASAFESRSICD
jgi:ABC-type branched-subunit amino acid transport system substrate-binding protein